MALNMLRFPLAMEQMPMMRFKPHRLTEETDKGYVFTLLVPGLEKENLQTDVVGNSLLIKAHVGREHEKLDFQEKFSLPKDADHENLRAELANGVLKVIVPKKLETEPTKIEVTNVGGAYDDGHSLTYRVPGASSENISVHVTEESLVVKADAGKHGFFRSFEREYTLPSDARAADVKAICKNGIFVVSVPRVKPHRVKIEEDLKVDDSSYSITVQLPGIVPAQIELEGAKNRFRLVIRDTDVNKTELYDHIFNIPHYVNVSEVSAAYKNGILTIAAPRKSAKSRPIAIASDLASNVITK